MLWPTSFAIVALLAASALAAPTPLRALSKQSFSMPVKPRIGVYRSPAQEMARTYAKYGWEVITFNPNNPWASIFGGDDSSTSAAAPVSAATSAPAYSAPPSPNTQGSDAVATDSATGTNAAPAASGTSSGGTADVTATPEQNESEYLEPVIIGGQTLNLDFDTGSADLWVFSSDLPSSESSGHTTFNPSESSTWSTYNGGSWEISYGDGSSASGSVGFDQVNIGGATVAKQAVELATAVSGSFSQDTSNDGLVGLAFSSINTIQPRAQNTFFENIMSQLAQPVFTANLEDTASGTYTFGEIDTSQYSGDIHFTPVDNSQGFWQFTSGSYSVGGQTSQCSTCSPAIADTGTSLILVDDDIVQAYYGQIQSAQYDDMQGGYTYKCNDDIPSFAVAVGDYMATLQGQQVAFAEVGNGLCFGGVQSNAGEGIQIFGDMLLKHFFAVFDGGNETFGLASKA